MKARAYRRREDGVIELLPPRGARVREVIVSTWIAIGGLVLTVAFAALVATNVRPENFRRTAGIASICFNWSAGPSGCWTR